MKKSIQKLQPYVPETPLSELKKSLNLDRIVRLSANENPYGTSPKVAAELASSFLEANRYPDGAAADLREAVSEFYAVDPKQLVFGVGLDEIIGLLNRTFLSAGVEVIVSVPTFSEYLINAQIEEAVPVSISTLANGHIDFSQMLNAITSKTKMIWLCNPNNPTGTYESQKDIQAFISQVPKDVLVVIDEAYLEYVTDEAESSAIHLPAKLTNVVVLRTFSKVYGLANFRVGFGVFPDQLAQYMQAVRAPYNLSTVSQEAALTALKDQEFVANTLEKTIGERKKWESFLQKNGIKFYHSQTNFLFIKVPKALRTAEFLLKNGFLVRSGLKLNWLRITIGEPDDNARLQALLLNEISKTTAP